MSRDGGACARQHRPTLRAACTDLRVACVRSSCGSPKSPTTIGPSTALTIAPRVISSGAPRARTRHRRRALIARVRRLSRRGGSARGGERGGPCAPRGPEVGATASSSRAVRARATPCSRSRPGSIPSQCWRPHKHGDLLVPMVTLHGCLPWNSPSAALRPKFGVPRFCSPVVN